MKKISVFFIFPFLISAQDAFISGNDTICSNDNNMAVVSVSFSGVSPFTFGYSINGVLQSPITTTLNPHPIYTSVAGEYILTSFSDANSFGLVSGSGLVNILQSPTALIYLESDTLSILYPTANFVSQSLGNIVSWDWNFGDNTINNNDENPKHIFPLDNEGLGISSTYQTALIVQDINGCVDTAISVVCINKEYWMYIPTSFTPDDDKKNDNFCVEYHGIRENTFLFKVYNAQGDLMYQSADPNELRCSVRGWDGTHYNSSAELPSDTYVYEIYFQDFEGWKHKEYGTIDLVR